MVKKRTKKVAKEGPKKGRTSRIQTPTSRLEETAMELTSNSDPMNRQAVLVAATDTTTGNAPTSVTASTITKEEKSPLMRLPAEIRWDILERVLQSVFDTRPYGFSTPELPADNDYMSRHNFPGRFYLNTDPHIETKLLAVLHLNRTIRNESIELFLDLALSKHIEIELENDKLHEEYQVAQDMMERPNSRNVKAGWHTRMRNLSKCQWQNKREMKDLDLVCQLFPEN